MPGDQYGILIVEDSNVDAMVVRAKLLLDGRFTVERVSTLADGIARLGNGRMPDAITLDLNLPDSAGLETFSEIHRLFPDQPVIILTGEQGEAMAVEAMRMGAQDYVHKASLDGAILVRSLLYAIERNKRRLVEQRQRAVERELKFAQKIQQHLLPNKSPDIERFDVAGRCVSTESTSGDFFDFIDHGDGKWDVVLADVCGHGLGPAMITVGTRRLLRSCAALHEDLGQLITIANQGICEDTYSSLFVTLFFVRLDPRLRSLTYVGAGHPAFTIDQNGQVTHLATRGIPTGVDPDCCYHVDGTVTLQPGQIVLLMTDGIWEAHKDDLIPFGKERAFEVVHRNRDRSAKEIVSRLISEVQSFCHPKQIEDDITAVVIKAT